MPLFHPDGSGGLGRGLGLSPVVRRPAAAPPPGAAAPARRPPCARSAWPAGGRRAPPTPMPRKMLKSPPAVASVWYVTSFSHVAGGGRWRTRRRDGGEHADDLGDDGRPEDATRAPVQGRRGPCSATRSARSGSGGGPSRPGRWRTTVRSRRSRCRRSPRGTSVNEELKMAYMVTPKRDDAVDEHGLVALHRDADRLQRHARRVHVEAVDAEQLHDGEEEEDHHEPGRNGALVGEGEEAAGARADVEDEGARPRRRGS